MVPPSGEASTTPAPKTPKLDDEQTEADQRELARVNARQRGSVQPAQREDERGNQAGNHSKSQGGDAQSFAPVASMSPR